MGQCLNRFGRIGAMGRGVAQGIPQQRVDLLMGCLIAADTGGNIFGKVILKLFRYAHGRAALLGKSRGGKQGDRKHDCSESS